MMLTVVLLLVMLTVAALPVVPRVVDWTGLPVRALISGEIMYRESCGDLHV